jgi:hypothetical protein
MLATLWRTEGLRRELKGEEEAESSILCRPNSAEESLSSTSTYAAG